MVRDRLGRLRLKENLSTSPVPPDTNGGWCAAVVALVSRREGQDLGACDRRSCDEAEASHTSPYALGLNYQIQRCPIVGEPVF